MDVWIVAAVAGAGYIVKHWQNLLRGRQSLLESYSGDYNFVKMESPPLIHPFHRLIQSKKLRKDASPERDQVSQVASTAEVASTSEFDGEELVTSDNFKLLNLFSISSLSPGFLKNQDLQEDGEAVRESTDIGGNSGDLLSQPSSGEFSSSYGYFGSRSALRSRQINERIIKPLSSLESCLMAQLYKEHAEMEEYMLSSMSLPSTCAVRPFFVTDGSGIISRAKADTASLQIGRGGNKLHKEAHSKENEVVYGIPPLSNFGSKELLRKTKVKTRKERCRRFSSSSKIVDRKCLNSQGPSHGALLFCLGISAGIISSFLTNKREVDKLNELLKQTENLVQDLQEELEMKDLLTVKELAVEDYESQDSHKYSYNNGAPHAFSREQNFDKSKECDHKNLHDQKAECSESLSKIEAELEAELERLELNMNSSSLEGRLSDLVELDPDCLPDVVHGELKAEMFGRKAGVKPYSDHDGSGTSTTHSAHYAISPRELSLRLHEVLQSRLEERVKELETALENSQRKVESMELERVNSWSKLSNSEVGSSSTLGSPIVEERSLVGEVINLSGEALDAYNELYDQFTKIDESEEEDLPSGVPKNNNQEGLHPVDQKLYRVQNGEFNLYKRRHTVNNGKELVTSIPHKGEERSSSNAAGVSGDQSDEMDKLIKQVLEKTRKGYPVVLNAERALFSMDENEY